MGGGRGQVDRLLYPEMQEPNYVFENLIKDEEIGYNGGTLHLGTPAEKQ